MSARVNIFAAVLLISGCGGGGSEAPDTPSPPPPPPTYSLSVNVSGLTGSGLEITANGSDAAIDSNGTHSLLGGLDSGTAYSVTITRHPTEPQQYCTVSNGSGTIANANVTNVSVSCVQGLVIAGQVTDAPVPNAEVTITLGGEVFSATADEEGFYTVLVGSDDMDAIITAEARGTGDLAIVFFKAILGAFGGLDEVDEGGFNITNVSSARAVLITRFNGGALPETADHLAELERTVSANELLDIAAAIKLIVDDPAFELPDGFDDVFEFALDPDAVRMFIASAESTKFQDARAEILADSRLVPKFHPTDLATTRLFVPATAPGLYSRQGTLLEFEDDGTGQATGTVFTVGLHNFVGDFDWTIVDGQVVLDYKESAANQPPVLGATPVSLLETLGLISSAEAGLLQLKYLIFVIPNREFPVSETIDLIARGDSTDQVVSRRMVRRVHEPIDLGEDGIVQADDLITSYPDAYIELWDIVDNEEISFADVGVGGDWALYLFRELGPMFNGPDDPVFRREFAADIVNISDDGAIAGVDGAQMSFGVNNKGRLELQYDGDWWQEIRILNRSGPVFGVYSSVLHVPTGARYGGYHFIVKVDPTLDADADFMTTDSDEFWHTYVATWRASFWDGASLDPARTGGFSGFTLDSNGDYLRPRYIQSGDDYVLGASGVGTWAIDGNDVVTMTNAANTFPDGIRKWIPLATDANGFFYVLERETRKGPGGDADPRVSIPGRINVVRKEPRLAAHP